MIMHGCQAKPKTPTIIEKICPQCGHEIELFSIDTQMTCEKCGFVPVQNAHFIRTEWDIDPKRKIYPRKKRTAKKHGAMWRFLSKGGYL